jgi:hypothetical protein
MARVVGQTECQTGVGSGHRISHWFGESSTWWWPLVVAQLRNAIPSLSDRLNRNWGTGRDIGE